MKYPAILSILAAGVLPAWADYTRDIDLGILPVGDTPLEGTTALTILTPPEVPEITQVGGRNEAVYHTDVTTPTGNWGNEIVYEFEITEPSILSITSISIGGDPDFILLSGLASADDGSGKVAASEAIAAVFLDSSPPATEQFPALQPGTYFLAIENWDGFDGSLNPGNASFEVNLTRETATAVDFAIDLGPLNVIGAPLFFDTAGSAINAELAIFDDVGELLFEDDDSAGSQQALIELADGLAPGLYYAVLGGSDTVFGPSNFDITPGADLGDWTLNHTLGQAPPPGQESGTLDNSHPSREVQYFIFDIVFAPPGFTGLGTIAMEGVPFTIDTLASGFDTELAVYEGGGLLWDTNDDFFGSLQSGIEFPTGLPAGTWWIALTGWNYFFGDGFFALNITTDQTGAPVLSDGGGFELAHPGGISTGSIAFGDAQWFSFEVEESLEPPSITITDLQFNPVSNEFTVSWDSNLSGPFDIWVGSGTDLGALGPDPANILPTLGAGGVDSPAIFTVPAALTGEPELFLQVTD